MTYGILWVLGRLVPLRVTARQEAMGMEVVQHGEEAYNSGEGAILVVADGEFDPPPVPVGRT